MFFLWFSHGFAMVFSEKNGFAMGLVHSAQVALAPVGQQRWPPNSHRWALGLALEKVASLVVSF